MQNKIKPLEIAVFYFDDLNLQYIIIIDKEK